jgi:hypothetical protein
MPKQQKQPNYNELLIKTEAREEVVNIFRNVTNQHSVQEYWTLCNEQPDQPTSEINQMLELGIF